MHKFAEILAQQDKQIARRMLYANLLASDKQLAQALSWLHSQQTNTEQAIKETRDKNNRGFTSGDAPAMSRFAEECNKWLDQLKVGKPKWPHPMSPIRMRIARERIRKYVGQLHRNLLAKAAEAAAAAPSNP